MTPDKIIADMGRQAIADHSTIVALRQQIFKAGLQIEAMLAHNADLHKQLERWQNGDLGDKTNHRCHCGTCELAT